MAPQIQALDLSEFRAQWAEENTAKRTLTSEATLAQLGGGSGYGGFSAAKLGRMTADWSSASRSADQELVTDLRKLRSRARVQAMNSPTAQKFLMMVRANVVGQKGVKLAFKVPSVRKTSKNGGLDDVANESLRKAWRRWGKKGSCTVCGRYSWKQLQRLFVESAARDGEQLVRFVFFNPKAPGAINPFGFALQLIDADQLDDTYNQLGRADGTQVRMGVEVDQYQRPLAYHIFNGNPYEVSVGSAQRVRVPADQIIHFFVAHRTGQSRGFPWFASTMGQLNMLDGYFSAELAGARITSSLLMSIEDDGKGGDDEFQGDGLNEDGTKAIDISGGMALELPTGQKLVNNTPNRPNSAFEPFLKQSGRLIAAGMNVAYHKLFNDLAGINYSSGRLGELEEREFWMEMQGHLIEDVLEPVYERWIKTALLNGALDVPFDLQRYTDEAVKWEPRRWPWVDPLKDVQANTLLVQNGFDTNESILESQGKDLEEVYQERKREQELADQLGLKFGTDIRGEGTSEVNSQEMGDDSEDAEQKPGTGKPAKPAAQTKPAPAKPKGRTLQLERGVHPANAPLFETTERE